MILSDAEMIEILLAQDTQETYTEAMRLLFKREEIVEYTRQMLTKIPKDIANAELENDQHAKQYIIDRMHWTYGLNPRIDEVIESLGYKPEPEQSA